MLGFENEGRGLHVIQVSGQHSCTIASPEGRETDWTGYVGFEMGTLIRQLNSFGIQESGQD